MNDSIINRRPWGADQSPLMGGRNDLEAHNVKSRMGEKKRKVFTKSSHCQWNMGIKGTRKCVCKTWRTYPCYLLQSLWWCELVFLYLRQAGYVFTPVCLFVSGITPTTIERICTKILAWIRTKGRVQEFFITYISFSFSSLLTCLGPFWAFIDGTVVSVIGGEDMQQRAELTPRPLQEDSGPGATKWAHLRPIYYFL